MHCKFAAGENLLGLWPAFKDHPHINTKAMRVNKITLGGTYRSETQGHQAKQKGRGDWEGPAKDTAPKLREWALAASQWGEQGQSDKTFSSDLAMGRGLCLG